MNNLLIVGYTTRDHLLLDLDETSKFKASRLAQLIIESYPDVGNCLILESSTPSKQSYLKYDDKGVPLEYWVKQNYHLVFDAYVGYSRCVHIIETLAELNVLQSEYLEIRQFRGDMTLRVSPKWLHHRVIEAPKTCAFVYAKTDTPFYGGIKAYQHVQACTSLLFSPDLNADNGTSNTGKNGKSTR